MSDRFTEELRQLQAQLDSIWEIWGRIHWHQREMEETVKRFGWSEFVQSEYYETAVYLLDQAQVAIDKAMLFVNDWSRGWDAQRGTAGPWTEGSVAETYLVRLQDLQGNMRAIREEVAEYRTLHKRLTEEGKYK